MGNGQVIREPDDRAIEDAIRSLNEEENPWALLHRDEVTLGADYVDPNTFVVRYIGDDNEFYETEKDEDGKPRSVPRSTVIRMFQAHQRGDDSWKGTVSWKKVKVGCLPFVLAAGLAIATLPLSIYHLLF